MGQVAFDTQEFVETLEKAGLPKDQARAISIAVRKSHEVADVATKADIAKRHYFDNSQLCFFATYSQAT